MAKLLITIPRTVVLPPVGCEYLSPEEVHVIIDNLPPDVTIELVRQDAPNTIEWSWPPMKMINVKWNAATVAADLEFENLAREPYPFLTFSPAEFPGVVQ